MPVDPHMYTKIGQDKRMPLNLCYFRTPMRTRHGLWPGVST